MIETKNMQSGKPRRFLYATIGLLVIAIVVIVLWFNWDRVVVRKYEMNVALDGKAPWDDVYPESETDPAPTVLYLKVGESYCFTAFQLPSLRDRLARERKSHVTVEYNEFTTFGHEGRHTLRSVDEIPLAIGNRIIQETHEFGGQILMNGNEAFPCPF